MMKKILHVISSPRGEASFSIKLGNAIIEKIKSDYPASTVTETNLAKKEFPHLQQPHINSFFTPAESRSLQDIEAVRVSDEAIREILDADIIVIGAPLYNFSIHSSLKAWLDHIIRAGVTFKYDENGVTGLVMDKKIYIAMSSGGIYSGGPMQSHDFVAPYLKTVLGFIGMTDVTIMRVEGTSLPEIKDLALEKAIDNITL